MTCRSSSCGVGVGASESCGVGESRRRVEPEALCAKPPWTAPIARRYDSTGWEPCNSRSLAPVSLFLGAALTAEMQQSRQLPEAISATVCDISNNPQRYDRQIVRVSAFLASGFEFTVLRETSADAAIFGLRPLTAPTPRPNSSGSTQAAKLLGIGKTQIYRRIKRATRPRHVPGKRREASPCARKNGEARTSLEAANP